MIHDKKRSMLTLQRMHILCRLLALCCASASALANSELVIAARRGDLSRVRVLLNTQIDVNTTREGDGIAALMAASTTGHHVVVRALLAAGVDVNARMSTGGTALMAAAALATSKWCTLCSLPRPM